MAIFHCDVLVIAAGAIGLATGLKCAERGMKVIIIDKEQTLFSHTSSRNSEVIHSGIYYKRSPNKERLCLEGRDLLYSYLKEKPIPHNKYGKIIFDNEFVEISMLHELHKNGITNGVSVKFASDKKPERINEIANQSQR